ncbi:MAG: hypothetical protein IJ138_04195, partial [Clostridia bacterium]|nr:hypothetical protein [Clostridia bacterium]
RKDQKGQEGLSPGHSESVKFDPAGVVLRDFCRLTISFPIGILLQAAFGVSVPNAASFFFGSEVL